MPRNGAPEPRTKATRVLLSNLHFANGVAVSPDQSFVLVVETGAYRVHRLWLDGPRRGESEIFIDNLPGFPDGISSNGKDKFWLALVSPRDKTLDLLLPHPFLRKIVLRLPTFLQAQMCGKAALSAEKVVIRSDTAAEKWIYCITPGNHPTLAPPPLVQDKSVPVLGDTAGRTPPLTFFAALVLRSCLDRGRSLTLVRFFVVFGM